MNEIIELLANYGNMTASEIALELERDLGSVERMLNAANNIGRNNFGAYYLRHQAA